MTASGKERDELARAEELRRCAMALPLRRTASEDDGADPDDGDERGDPGGRAARSGPGGRRGSWRPGSGRRWRPNRSGRRSCRWRGRARCARLRGGRAGRPGQGRPPLAGSPNTESLRASSTAEKARVAGSLAGALVFLAITLYNSRSASEYACGGHVSCLGTRPVSGFVSNWVKCASIARIRPRYPRRRTLVEAQLYIKFEPIRTLS